MKNNKDEEIKKTKEQDREVEKTLGKTRARIEKSKTKILQNIAFFFVFCATAVFMFWTKNVSTPDNAALIAYITISVLVNVSIVLVLFGTGIGTSLVMRFFNKFRYKSGKYINTLHIMKSGVIRERFVKKNLETGTFRMLEKPYISSPKLTLNYNGIPTSLHREGNPDPLDIWEEDLTGSLSNSEMDIAMNSMFSFDVKEWLEKNKMIMFIGGFAVIAVCVASAFFGWQAYEMLRDGSFKQLESIACNNLPDPTEILAEKILGGE